MSDLIRRSDLLRILENNEPMNWRDTDEEITERACWHWFNKIVEEADAIDAVEVVRCKDCEFCRDSFDPWTKTSVQVCGYVGFNPVQSSQVEDNDYCSRGKRREDNEID